MLAGCSGSPTLAPKPSGMQDLANAMMRQVPAPVGMFAALKLRPNSDHPYASFDSCPATGPITYISDYNNNVINIFAGTFKGQAACGAISGSVVLAKGLKKDIAGFTTPKLTRNAAAPWIFGIV